MTWDEASDRPSTSSSGRRIAAGQRDRARTHGVGHERADRRSGRIQEGRGKGVFGAALDMAGRWAGGRTVSPAGARLERHKEMPINSKPAQGQRHACVAEPAATVLNYGHRMMHDRRRHHGRAPRPDPTTHRPGLPARRPQPGEVTLLPVSKTFGVDAIRAAMALGLNRFGENKTQEIRQKAAALSRGLQWVLIGHLQTNKAKDAARDATEVQSLDRLDLAEALHRRLAQEAARWTRWCRSRPPASPASTAWRRKTCRPSCAASRPTSPRCA